MSTIIARSIVRTAMIALLVATLSGLASAVPIQITYTDSPGEGFNDATLGAARRNALEAAASNWSQRLSGNVPIVITAAMDPLGGNADSALLGMAGPTDFFVNSTGLPLANVYYPVALGNQLTGVDLNRGAVEIDAQFNSDVDSARVLDSTNFYYGTDGRPPGDNIDFYSVALHELGHGLGFLDSLNQNGSYFFSGRPDIFDTLLANGPAPNATRLTALSQSARSTALATNALYFAGANTNAANSGVNARLYAPNPYEPGSSVSHLDEDIYQGVNELMTPFMTAPSHEPGPVAAGMLRDMGWGGAATAPTPTPISGSPTPVPPTPLPPPGGPPNDNFANARVLTGNAGRVTGTNVNATKELGEPSHSPARNRGGRSIWYRWIAPGHGKVTLTTAGSDFDTFLAIYTGSAVNTLISLTNGKNDDASDSVLTSSITVNVVAGTTYFIAVDGYNGGSGAESGRVMLNWSFIYGVPANNNFAGAQALSGTSGRVNGTNINATKETGEPNHAGNAGGKSVWYRWMAPAGGRVTFTTTGSTFNTLLAIYTGTTLSALTPVAANDNVSSTNSRSTMTFNVMAGTSYRIAVDGYKATTAGASAASGTVVLDWTLSPAAALKATTSSASKAPEATSPAQLSTLTANAVTGLLTLRFSAALDEVLASDTTSYSVTINGRLTPVESAAYAALSRSVTLALPEGSLRPGDLVSVSWRLRDAQGRILFGQARPIIVSAP